MNKTTSYYFLGIAGQVMSGLAVAMKRAGHSVSGVAVNAYPPATDTLDQAGIHYHTSYDLDHVDDDQVVVLGNGIAPDNIELVEAQRRGSTIVSFPQLLEHLHHTERRIVVAGSHGKTTTTTLISWLLQAAGLNPDFVIGMVSRNFGQSVRLEQSQVMVLEGDEYTASMLDATSKFMYYHPDILVVTSLEWDHPDVFASFTEVQTRFRQLIDQLPAQALIIGCRDDHHVVELLEQSGRSVVWYGLADGADWQARQIEFGPRETSFDLMVDSIWQCRLTMPLTGDHNVRNTLAALVAISTWNLDWDDLARGLGTFAGAARRFELVGQVGQITVIDDYAHHPTEVTATLQGARARYPTGRLWAFYVPHTYSRTAALLEAYGQAFAQADVVVLGQIEAAREVATEATIRSEDVAQQISQWHQQLHYLADIDQARRLIVESVQPGDVVVCMSVSGANRFAQRLVEDLEQRWK